MENDNIEVPEMVSAAAVRLIPQNPILSTRKHMEGWSEHFQPKNQETRTLQPNRVEDDTPGINTGFSAATR